MAVFMATFQAQLVYPELPVKVFEQIFTHTYT